MSATIHLKAPVAVKVVLDNVFITASHTPGVSLSLKVKEGAVIDINKVIWVRLELVKYDLEIEVTENRATMTLKDAKVRFPLNLP